MVSAHNLPANTPSAPAREQREASALALILERLDALASIDARTAGIAESLRALQGNAAANGEMLQTLCERSVELEHSIEDMSEAVREAGQPPPVRRDRDREAGLALGALVALSAAICAWRRSRRVLRRRCPSTRSLLLLQALAAGTLFACGASDTLRSLPLLGPRYAPDGASVRRARQLSAICLVASTWALPLKLVVGSERR